MAVRPVVLVICDGWGINADDFGNAIAAARTPAYDRLLSECAHCAVDASGEAVGLPEGQQGNSEVGHLTIGTGRILYQPLTRINRAIRDGSFYENAALLSAIDHARDAGTTLHCLGLVSPGGVHSDQRHGVALAELARRRGLQDVQFHAFTDGRDEPPSSAAGFLATLSEELRSVGCGRIASVCGRYWAMDRDRRWERTQRAWTMLVDGEGGVTADPVAWVEEQYTSGVTDEFLPPVAVVDAAHPRRTIRDGDAVIFWNFRPDRARQLTHALVDRDFEDFRRTHRPEVTMVTFTEYERDLPVGVAFPREDIGHTLAEEVSRAGLAQFHVAETEKYAHVTYFINGGREDPFTGEDRLLVPSPKVATYDLTPEMSAVAVTDAVVDHLTAGETALVVVNFANPDMVGHTGDFDATVRAVECIDGCLERIVSAVRAAGGAMVMTADHGNAEYKIDRRDNSPLTAHTTAPVPVIVCGGDVHTLRSGGGLQDVAPTVLEILGLERPDEMTGRSLVAG